MEETPKVVVLSAKDVNTAGLKRVLTDAQDDAMAYEFEFREGLGDKFPEDIVEQIKPNNIVVFLWNPKKKHTLDCFKKMILKFGGATHFLLFCQTGDSAVSAEEKNLLDKWLKQAAIPEGQYCILDQGMDVEDSQLKLLERIPQKVSVHQNPHGFEVMSLDASTVSIPPADAQPKAFFENGYGHDLSRSHSRQIRASFIEVNYKPNAQGEFELAHLVQLYAVYMSVPVGSDLSKMVEKALAKALMTSEEYQRYLASVDSGRSTIMGKGWDRVSKQLRALLEKKFNETPSEKPFADVVDALLLFQNWVSSQETTWGFKLWGSKSTVVDVQNGIENTLYGMMEIYPLLLKSEITQEERVALQSIKTGLLTEIVDIVDSVFPSAQFGLGQ